ncbi:MAG: outer membrane lipoprotein-sorting protein [Candidatus Omnitrophica bacterium]|nr:outer membrane lipoprotein-sorting protein [Candidatus Omnitrophota bacterium]
MKRIILIVFCAFGILGDVQAQELSVEEIVRKANAVAYYSGEDGLSDVKMTIIDSQERERIREFRIMRFDVQDGGDQKFYVYFKKPADVSKMVYMVWKHLGADDDRWLYLPALDLVKRIAASDKRSSFVGSHFVYEDVSGRNIEADEHIIDETTERFYKLKNVPKDISGLEFAYYMIWVDKVNFLPMRAEYYDNENKLIRSIEALEVEDIQGHPTVKKSVARDLNRGGKTVMEFSNVQYDVGLTENIFAERYLRKAPIEWLK